MRQRTLCGLLAVASVLVAAGVAIAVTTPTINATGAGRVKIGKTYRALHDQRLIGRIRHGCELGGPKTRSAKLRAPLHGLVNFTLTSPRKVTDITVTGGARTARGVGIGATLADAKAAYPHAKVDHSTDQTFEVTLVTVPRSEGGKITFAVSTATGKVTLIGVPIIAFCE